MNAFTIGKAAKSAGVGVETIRFYEKRGLITQPAAQHGKYREYPLNVVTRIHFIKRAQELGFTLAEIRELMRMSESPGSNRKDVKELAEKKVETIRGKIADLQQLENTLTHLISACNGRGPIIGCPIIEALQQDTDTNLESNRD